MSSFLGGFAVAPAPANPPKSDDKYAQKSVQLVRVSSFRSDFLQNPYFRRKKLNCNAEQCPKNMLKYWMGGWLRKNSIA